MPIRGDSFEMLPEAIEAARHHVMSAEEREEQRRSFAHGNVALHNPDVTREVIDKAADDLKAKLHPAVRSYMEDPLADLYGLQIEDCANAMAVRAEKVEADVQTLRKLVEAADYLQHCRRSHAEHPHFTSSVEANRKRVERASDHYDHLRGQVKL